jgi:hypothetical protein
MNRHALSLVALAVGATTLSTGCTSAVDAYIKDASNDLAVASQSSPPTCVEGDKGFAAMEKEFEAVEPGTEAGTVRVAMFYTGACLRYEEAKAAAGDGVFRATAVPVNEDLLDVMIRAYDEEPNAENRDRMDGVFYSSLDYTFEFALYGGILANGEVYPAPRAPQGTMGGVEGATPEQHAEIQAAWCEYVGPVEYKRYLSGKAPAEGGEYLMRGETLSGLIAHGCGDMVTALLDRWLKDFDAAPGAVETKLRDGSADPNWKSAGVNKYTEMKLAKKDFPSANDIASYISVAANHNPTAAKAQVQMLTERVTSCAAGQDLLKGLQRETPAAIKDDVALFSKRLNSMCGG